MLDLLWGISENDIKRWDCMLNDAAEAGKTARQANLNNHHCNWKDQIGGNY